MLPTDHTTDAAQLPAFLTDAPKRTRRSHKRVPMDHAPTVLHLAADAVSVDLFGRRAAGRRMVLDADVWTGIAATHGRWVLNADRGGREYVRAGGSALAAMARQPGSRPTATLARIITGARPHEQVTYADRDRLNLRRANLRLEDRRGRPVPHRPHGPGSL